MLDFEKLRNCKWKRRKYYVIIGSRLVDVETILTAGVAEAVIEELEELAQPSPGDEEYARVYSKTLTADDIEAELAEPELADCLGFHREDTGLEFVDVLQWTDTDSTTYYLLKNSRLLGIEDALGPLDSGVIECIFEELDGLFQSLEEAGECAYVRQKSFDESDLNEDEMHNLAFQGS